MASARLTPWGGQTAHLCPLAHPVPCAGEPHHPGPSPATHRLPHHDPRGPSPSRARSPACCVWDRAQHQGRPGPLSGSQNPCWPVGPRCPLPSPRLGDHVTQGAGPLRLMPTQRHQVPARHKLCSAHGAPSSGGPRTPEARPCPLHGSPGHGGHVAPF